MGIMEREHRSDTTTQLISSSADSTEGDFTDAELTAFALAADPDLPLTKDAVPLSIYLAQLPIALPDWYMPTAMMRGGKRWRVPVVMLIVAAFLVIEGFGLCNTFGQLTLP
jgi:hypothetical protein